MKVALSVIGKFHSFDLARELHTRDALAGIYTGYPTFKLKGEQLPESLIHTHPWLHSSYMAYPWKQHTPESVLRQWRHWAAVDFGSYVERNLVECDVYVGLSGSTLAAGKEAQRRGARYVCDRGSAHIRVQDELMREEYERWGVPFMGIDPRAIAREEAEYAEADCITVPSSFAMRSFLSQGVPFSKMRQLPYGVNLSRFQPIGKPAVNRFDILFVGNMSLEKGVQYLTSAYQRIRYPAKSLTFVGTASHYVIEMLTKRGLWPSDARVLGHIPQTELKSVMSRSHVMVLPSIQEGLAMVQAQAMACGCPVIASQNTGGEDLFSDGQEGFTVPIRDVNALAERLQLLADQPHLRADMGQQALIRVQSLGGWRDYGEKAIAAYQEILMS